MQLVLFVQLSIIILSIRRGLFIIQMIKLPCNFFYPFYQRIPLSLFTLAEYFTKCLIPVNISYLYPFPFLLGEQVPWWLWTYVIAIPVIIFCFYKRLKARWLLLGLLFFFIHIVLVLNFFSLARYSLHSRQICLFGKHWALFYCQPHYYH